MSYKDAFAASSLNVNPISFSKTRTTSVKSASYPNRFTASVRNRSVAVKYSSESPFTTFNAIRTSFNINPILNPYANFPVPVFRRVLIFGEC